VIVYPHTFVSIQLLLHPMTIDPLAIGKCHFICNSPQSWAVNGSGRNDR
jgi:hypothetical protein